MKALFNTVAGWLKVITYAATIAGLVLGWINAQTALTISLVISALIKLAQQVTRITPSTKDDEFIAAVEKILKDKGVIKE